MKNPIIVSLLLAGCSSTTPVQQKAASKGHDKISRALSSAEGAVELSADDKSLLAAQIQAAGVIPSGFRIGDYYDGLLIAKGHFSVSEARDQRGAVVYRKDQGEDVAVVFEEIVPQASEENPYPPAGRREVAIFQRQADGNLARTPLVALKAAGLIMSRDEGGMMGDPFQDLASIISRRVNNDFGDSLLLDFYGGSADRWHYEIKVQQRSVDNGRPDFYFNGFDAAAFNTHQLIGNKLSINTGTGGFWYRHDFAPEFTEITLGERVYKVPELCIKYDFSVTPISIGLQDFCAIRGGQVFLGAIRYTEGGRVRTRDGVLVEEKDVAQNEDGDSLAICRWGASNALKEKFLKPVSEVPDFNVWSNEVQTMALGLLTREKSKWKCTPQEQQVLSNPYLFKRLLNNYAIERLAAVKECFESQQDSIDTSANTDRQVIAIIDNCERNRQ